MSVIIIAEHDNNQLSLVTLPVITAGQQLSAQITVLVAGNDCAAVAKQAANVTGVTQVICVDDPVYAHHLPENLAPLITTLKSADITHILAPASAFGKNLLPRVAALLDVAQVSDVIKIIAADTYIRPIYAGSAFATVRSSDAIQVLTIRTSAFAAAQQSANAAPILSQTIVIENSLSHWVASAPTVSERPDLSVARVVISGGRGLQSAENFTLLTRIADQLGAAVGASRAAVDAGFAPNDWQIGQTGKVVAPDLYIAVGISGAIQHIAGMKESKVIVAINKDPDAAIFQVADFGIVGDLFDILPELERVLAQS